MMMILLIMMMMVVTLSNLRLVRPIFYSPFPRFHVSDPEQSDCQIDDLYVMMMKMMPSNIGIRGPPCRHPPFAFSSET